jgi:ABC-type lipoprotein export system ATPase subunit
MHDSDRFNIFDELQDWSKKLEIWQRLALLILLKKGSLDNDDLLKVYDEFKIDHGLLESKSERNLYELDKENIPNRDEEHTTVLLESLRNVNGVNALIENQDLNFGKNLTIIYGPNGSGKSGYARILKNACFTRSQDQDIIGNIQIPPTEQNTPSAEFAFSDKTVEKFIKDQPCSEILNSFAVYDNSCIRVYTDEQNNFNVTPYGFDVFQGLGNTADSISEYLKNEIKERTPNIETYKIEDSNSKVSEKLNNLSCLTNLKDLENIGVFGNFEEKRIKEIDTLLADIKKTDPEELIKQKTRDCEDIKAVIEKCQLIYEEFDISVITEYAKIIEEVQDLNDIAKANSAAQFNKEIIQPVGSRTWRNLLEAAIKFNEEAYQDNTFPAPIDDVRCVLCQQKLDSDAKIRLSKFFNFVRSDTEVKLRNKKSELIKIKENIESIDLNFFNKELSLRRAIDDVCPDFKGLVDNLLYSAKTIQQTILNNIIKGKWESVSELQKISLLDLNKVILRLDHEVKELQKKDVKKITEELNSELQLLNDRKYLNRNLDKIKRAVYNLKWIDKAEKQVKVITRIKRNITDKQKILTKELIAKGFIKKFKVECAILNFDLPIDIKISGSSYVTKRKIEVGKDNRHDFLPSKILSEGEQTAVALADFLAEISLDDRQLGIIFDDPVTSLDHDRKERIAKRLVDEARKRQVIIFTHDILFTNHIAKAAEAKGIKFAGRTVSLGVENNIPGYIGFTVFPHNH